MSIFNTMADKIRDGIRTWLRVQPAQRGVINIQEIFDFEGNAIKNQIWYRGVSEELSQLIRLMGTRQDSGLQNALLG